MSLKGKLDMTTGTGWRHVLNFSLPIMLGNLLQQLYNTVDGIVVGRYVSDAALGAVGNCASLNFLFIAISFGLSNGCGIVTSQFFGAKREAEVRKAASTAFVLLGVMGLAGVVFGISCSGWLLGTVMDIRDPEVLKEAVTYFSIYSVGLIFMFVYNAVSALLRSLGDSKATLYFLLVSTFVNLGLDLLFVLVFDWGVAGVAIATVIAQCISTLFSLFYTRRRYPILSFRLRELRFYPDMGKKCLQMGIPSMLQQSVVAVGGMFMQRLVNYFGKALMAAFTVGNRVENYIFVPIMALNAGMSTFTGQNMGADRPERVKECWRKVILMSLAFSAFIAVLIYVFANPISTLFGVSGEGLRMSVEMIRFMSFFVLLFSLYLPTVGLLQGSGDAFFAMLCSMSTLGIRVLAAYAMVFLFDVGYQAVWYAVPMGWLACVALSWGRYFSGAWQKKSLVKRG
ncbi:MAG: MATE family efflux transporter [Oscillospiraceae bacterium]|nr:MATE family efflux transporter [Oscillospiraceae bacterium]